MQVDTDQTAPGIFAPVIENPGARGRVVLVCEHAANAFPAPWGDLGLSTDQKNAHVAWDPGAIGLARGLAARLDAVLVHAPVSRLVYDCNRAPNMPGAMPARSETYDIPGNAVITPQERARRTAAIYVPFHAGLHALLMDRVALGMAPVVVTIHSFTPVYFGKPRLVEFGVIHDADDELSRNILRQALDQTSLRSALNAPYSAADDVTHTLRIQATPYGLPNAMLEVRNDLIATVQTQEAMADILGPVITAAVDGLGMARAG
ncbi:MAG: N-formylglutamate amidohydrolase [Gemmobacter sp.]|nr:N-formylglutamate amidohydrolase [Gemmobacter sp.]